MFDFDDLENEEHASASNLDLAGPPHVQADSVALEDLWQRETSQPVDPELLATAVANAARVLGSEVTPNKKVPVDWAEIRRGKDLFVPGWGGFDIPVALRAATGRGSCEAVPSVAVLQSYGYAEKFFSSVSDSMHKEQLRRAIEVSRSALAKYVVRYQAFWCIEGQANRLDEVARHFETLRGRKAAESATLKEEPRAMLNRLARDQAINGTQFVRFHHLVDTVAPMCFDDDGHMSVLDTPSIEASFELSVLSNSHSVVHAALELNNCAATYVGDVRRKRCVLIVLRKVGKLVAMGEWDPHERRWSQISEHSDEPARPEWQSMYAIFAPTLLPLQARLELPGRRKDSVSIFSPQAAKNLRMLSNQPGTLLSVTPKMGRSLSALSCHEESASALLLWALEEARACQEALSILEQDADVDSMTDSGWTALMLAVETRRLDMVKMLLENNADMDAKGAGSGKTALMIAAAIGFSDLVQVLVDKRADIDIVERLSGKTALIVAVESAQWDSVLILQHAKANLEARRYDGRTALMLAAAAGHVRTVTLMLEHKAEIEAKNDEGGTALMTAADKGQWGAVLELLLAGANFDKRIGADQHTLLMAAATGFGGQEVINLLVRQRADINAKNKAGDTAVLISAYANQWSTLELIAQLGADLDIKGSKGATALAMAIENCEEAAVRMLVTMRAKVDDVGLGGKTAVGVAVHAGHERIVQQLAAQRASVNVSGVGTQAPLIIASGSRKWSLVQMLMDLHAELNMQDAIGSTALMIAAASGQVKVVRRLLEQRADLEVKAIDNSTALLAAARERKWQLVRLLVDARADADVWYKDADKSKSLLMLACDALQWDVILAVAKRGANLETNIGNGRTVLMLAAENGQEEVVWCLLERRAHVEARCNQGYTPMLWATIRQRLGTMQLLKDRGALLDEALRHTRDLHMIEVLREWSGLDDDNVEAY